MAKYYLFGDGFQLEARSAESLLLLIEKQFPGAELPQPRTIQKWVENGVSVAKDLLIESPNGVKIPIRVTYWKSPHPPSVRVTITEQNDWNADENGELIFTSPEELQDNFRALGKFGALRPTLGGNVKPTIRDFQTFFFKHVLPKA